MNSVNIIGNLTRDPEVRYTSAGSPIVGFGLAWNGRRKDNHGEWVDDPNFFDVTGFGEKWEKLAAHLSKGSKVGISGRLDWSSWEKDGVKRSKVQIIAFDLTFCTRKGEDEGGQSSSPSEPAADGFYPSNTPSHEDDDIPF